MVILPTGGGYNLPMVTDMIRNIPYEWRFTTISPELLEFGDDDFMLEESAQIWRFDPSRAFVTEKDLRRELEMLPLPGPGYTGGERSLHWHGATPEKMHDKLWRWLVVYDVR